MEQQDSRGLRLNMARFKVPGDDVLHIAKVVVLTWMDVKLAIAPVIGARGFLALYERSAHLICLKHPWMASAQECLALETTLAALETVLAQQDSVTATAGGAEHLQAFYALLSSLIGTSLSDSLLRSIWENSTNGLHGLDSPR